MRVEMIVNDEHRNKFIAHGHDGDAYACVDDCYAKLERQLSDHKKKLRNRKHSGEENHGLTLILRSR
jgi:putative sigma-54 modulation protein